MKESKGEHRWTARDETVFVRTEQHLNMSDSRKVEIAELGSLLGPEDLEVDLRDILRYASRKSGRNSAIFRSRGQSEHLAASRVRWDERRILMATQEEEARRNVQELDQRCQSKLDSGL